MIAAGKTFFRSYAEIFFLQGGFIGAALCAVTLLNPHVGLAGMLAVLAAFGFARLIGMGEAFLESGYYTYNPLLVGLSLGYLFRLTPLTVFFIIAAGALTLLVTVCLANVFGTWFKLPILSLPFVVVSSLAYLASLRYSNLVHAGVHLPGWLTEDYDLPAWLAGYFKAWGALLFSPGVLIGGLFAFIVLCRSRILFLLSVLGYGVGSTVRRGMLGSPSQAYGDILNFNFLLIAMALGGVFLVPSWRSYCLAAVGVAVSTVVMDAITGFWSYYGIPAFTLPFNLTSLAFIYVLGLTGSPLIARRVGATPEDTLGDYIANRLRYRGGDRTLTPPFSGKWRVWQGVEGEWTHQGAWRFALDFVITDADGKTHRGNGLMPEDYYCQGKPVLAPVRGRVVRIVDDLPDNPVGQPDQTNNWGNLIIIHDERGFFVELSHLAAGSVQVKPGEWVERGAVLARCGNSGYSPQPHLHVQVQLTDEVGAASAPFSLVRYASENTYHANDVPVNEQAVEPLFPNKRIEAATNFALDEEYVYLVRRRRQPRGELRLRVRMAPDGTFYFDSGRATLSFSRHEGTFYAHHFTGNDPRLRAFFLALPRLPLAARDQLHWTDYVPVGLVTRGWRGALIGLASSLAPGLAEVVVRHRFIGESRIETALRSRPLGLRKAGSVTFNRRKGFATVEFDGWEFTRRDDAP